MSRFPCFRSRAFSSYNVAIIPSFAVALFTSFRRGLDPYILQCVFEGSGILWRTGRRFAPAFEDAVRPKRIAWILCLGLLVVIPGNAQSTSPRGSGSRTVDGSVAPGDPDEIRDKVAREMAKKANMERQALLKADTDKLLKLSTELKEYVDKTNENVLSLEVLKKAEEIEKLAKSVKEKMKGLN
jgi:hypothetical protein